MGAALYFSHPACEEHDTGDHPERAARIAAIEARLAACDWAGYERREADPAPREAIVAVHSPEYVDRIRALAGGDGGTLAEDTLVGPGSYRAAAAAAGAACAMADALVAGEARVAF